MKILRTFLFLLLSFPFFSSAQSSSPSSMQYLEKNFPKLTRLYEKELREVNTHYIFAIDVSGSMNKYDNVVTPALKAFANALPEGEQVTVIPFGAYAKANTPGLSVNIDSSTKPILINSLTGLYTNRTHTPDFKRHTDIQKAVEAIIATIRTNKQSKMNVVVIITDFLNDLPGKGEIPLEESVLANLQKSFNDVTDGAYTRVVAIQLPQAGTGKGYSLDQLQEKVFNKTGKDRRFDVVEAFSNSSAISHWFNQLSREIMTGKLQAVVGMDNQRFGNPRLVVSDIDINGNMTGELHWTPNKLYKEIKIDTLYTDEGSDFKVFENKGARIMTSDSVVTGLKLGKFRHNSMGLHHYDENFNMNLSLPTTYDAELQSLSVDKPGQKAVTEKTGWVWTFWLGFWTCVVIAIILIWYFIQVIKASIRNKRAKFNGKVKVKERDGDDKIEKTISNEKNFKVGKNGTGRLRIANADWTIAVDKKTFSRFLFWKKPYFTWKPDDGYVCQGRTNTSGGDIGKSKDTDFVSFIGGKNKKFKTHTIDINLEHK